MTQAFRIENGGLINRDKKLSFKFNGTTYFGFEGDTLASALLANGCLLYTSPSPRDKRQSRMPSSA